jgi:dihydrolipoamide dehydrogenase
METYDVVVIGAGPGGYVAAIRCAQLGLRTACVEQWRDPRGNAVLGGTCLNVGCIPSKALLDSSHHFEHIARHAREHGILVEPPRIDIDAMMQRKNKVVQTLTQGVASLFRKHKIDSLPGRGYLLSPDSIGVALNAGGEAKIKAGHVIIATGSVPAVLPQCPADQQYIVDSTGALAFASVPKRLGVIGAGVIGLELGSVWRRLGAEVLILEALPDFLPAADQQCATQLIKILKKQGLDIRLGCMVTASEVRNDAVAITYEQQGKREQTEVDKLIVAVGRRPYTEGLHLDAAGIAVDRRGYIEVDAHCRTAVPNVYAVGDVVRGPMLAHKASEEGVAVAERIAGQATAIDHATVPWVIYTWPEFAWVGETEQALRAAGRDIRVGTFPFMASGRARAMGDIEGMVKLIGDAATDRLLGAHIIGPNASELISEIVLGMAFSASTEDLARTIHAHPTLAEATREAALAVAGRPLHI